MGNYSGMSNDQAAAQYAEDCGREQDRDAYIENLVSKDMIELSIYGRIVDGTPFEKILDDARECFASEWMYENYNPTFSDEQKIACLDKYRKAAFEHIRKHLYEKYEDEL